MTIPPRLLTELEPDLGMDAYEYPKPEKSLILFQIIEGGDHNWPDHEIYECQYEGGSAEIENDVGMLSEAIQNLWEGDPKVGWWVIEGFYGRYTRGDGWSTDDDVDFECDDLRPARWSDIEHFGVGRLPFWAGLLSLIGIDKEVPRDYQTYQAPFRPEA